MVPATVVDELIRFGNDIAGPRGIRTVVHEARDPGTIANKFPLSIIGKVGLDAIRRGEFDIPEQL
jgi:hypothetical protein